MKKSALIFLFSFLLGSLAFAQGIDDEITLMQAQFGMEKKQLVQAVMDLPESLSPGFWTIYQQYEGERQILARERILLINEYLTNYENIDNEIADSLTKAILKNSVDRSKLHKKYYKKFKKNTTARDAAKFLQLDIYIHNTLRNLSLQELPFIDEFK
ncbi:MAG: hypothetical protein EA341_18005 [Mongoliibacter sp.]|uniref:hypothetical protein n=1 Tax=Mongoliibacter sp. TaxID=2022438 RepID=UPI0012F3D8B2|nr:hypothetical protein [Mongoliibacter sp.]TVP43572.1 MAG: hypothetical protein EA341_18005 [Mongoliibacter sp.]